MRLSLLLPLATWWKNRVFASPAANQSCLEHCLQSISIFWSTSATAFWNSLRVACSSADRGRVSSKVSISWIALSAPSRVHVLSSQILLRHPMRWWRRPLSFVTSLADAKPRAVWVTRRDREVVDFTRSRVKNNSELTNLMKMYRIEGYNGK